MGAFSFIAGSSLGSKRGKATNVIGKKLKGVFGGTYNSKRNKRLLKKSKAYRLKHF